MMFADDEQDKVNDHNKARRHFGTYYDQCCELDENDSSFVDDDYYNFHLQPVPTEIEDQSSQDNHNESSQRPRLFNIPIHEQFADGYQGNFDQDLKELENNIWNNKNNNSNNNSNLYAYMPVPPCTGCSPANNNQMKARQQRCFVLICLMFILLLGLSMILTEDVPFHVSRLGSNHSLIIDNDNEADKDNDEWGLTTVTNLSMCEQALHQTVPLLDMVTSIKQNNNQKLCRSNVSLYTSHFIFLAQKSVSSQSQCLSLFISYSKSFSCMLY